MLSFLPKAGRMEGICLERRISTSTLSSIRPGISAQSRYWRLETRVPKGVSQDLNCSSDKWNPVLTMEIWTSSPKLGATPTLVSSRPEKVASPITNLNSWSLDGMILKGCFNLKLNPMPFPGDLLVATPITSATARLKTCFRISTASTVLRVGDFRITPFLVRTLRERLCVLGRLCGQELSLVPQYKEVLLFLQWLEWCFVSDEPCFCCME